MKFFNDIVSQAMQSFLLKFIDDFISAFGNIFVKIMGIGNDILSIPALNSGIMYAQGLAIALLGAKVINESMQTWILYTNGDPDADPTGLLIRTARAIAVICTIPWIVKWIYGFGTAMASDVANLNGLQTIQDLNIFDVAMYLPKTSIVLSLITIVSLVILLFIFFQSFIRAAELGLLAVIGPILSLNLTANNTSMFSAWFREVCVLSVSQAIQIFMIKMSFYLIADPHFNFVPAYSGLMFLAWIWVTLKAPKFIKQFVYASGLGGAAGSAAQQVGTIAITQKVMQKVITKGAA